MPPLARSQSSWSPRSNRSTESTKISTPWRSRNGKPHENPRSSKRACTSKAYRYWKKTGKTEWIARYRYSPEQPWLTKKLRHKPNLAGATKLPLVQVDSTLRSKSNFATRDEYPHQKPDAQPSTKQILLAAPFDYLFDPVVSVAGTSLWLAGVTVGEIIASPVLLFQQNSEPEVYQLSPTQEPIPDDWE